MPPTHTWHLSFLLLSLLLPTPTNACKGKIDLVFCIDASGSVDDNEYSQQEVFVKKFVDIFSGNCDAQCQASTTWQYTWKNDKWVENGGNAGNVACDLPSGHAPGQGDGCGNFDGENGLKVSIHNFASGNTINLGLSTDYQAVKVATKQTENGETNTHKCLLAAEAMIRDPAQGARNGAAKIIVLLADGTPTLDKEATNAANAAKNAGTLIIGVGVDTGHCYAKGICAPTPTTPGGCCSAGDITIMGLCTSPGVDHYMRVGGFDALATKLKAITKLSCPVDCQGDWSNWGTCNKATGKQERTFTVTKAPADGGIVCPTKETQPCNVDCISTFGQWSSTSCTTSSTQTQPTQITQQSKNGGQACPPDNTRPCEPCAFTWSEWSTCDVSTGKQTRTPTITSQPQNGGTACPSPEERSCATDCVFTW